MQMLTFYHLALVIHIIGLTLMAGTTFTDYTAFRRFWKQWKNGILKRETLREAMPAFPVFIGIGLGLLIISGITMMALTHGAYGEQVWFRIKFALIVLVTINGMAVGRKQGKRLRKILSAETPVEFSDPDIAKIRAAINRFHTSQLLLFIVIFVLSVFKFN